MIQTEDEDVRVLASLGLTERQAKVYLALLRTGVSKAEGISRASLVHRQEIYRVVESLKEFGLVDVEIKTPMMFNAIPIKDALAILVRRKTLEFDEIQEKAKSLVDKLSRADLQVDQLAEEPYFRIISESERGRRYRNALENACRSVDIIIAWSRFRKGFYLLDDSLRKALAKGVKIRVITDKPKSEVGTGLAAEAFTKNHNLEMKIVSDAPPAVVSIFDSVEVSIAVKVMGDLSGGPHLWSNNPNLVALGQGYFDCLWAQLKSL